MQIETGNCCRRSPWNIGICKICRSWLEGPASLCIHQVLPCHCMSELPEFIQLGSISNIQIQRSACCKTPCFPRHPHLTNTQPNPCETIPLYSIPSAAIYVQHRLEAIHPSIHPSQAIPLQQFLFPLNCSSHHPSQPSTRPSSRRTVASRQVAWNTMR